MNLYIAIELNGEIERIVGVFDSMNKACQVFYLSKRGPERRSDRHRTHWEFFTGAKCDGLVMKLQLNRELE